MEKEKIVQIVVKVVVLVLIAVAVFVYYKKTEERYVKEQEALELRLKHSRNR